MAGNGYNAIHEQDLGEKLRIERVYRRIYRGQRLSAGPGSGGAGLPGQYGPCLHADEDRHPHGGRTGVSEKGHPGNPGPARQRGVPHPAQRRGRAHRHRELPDGSRRRGGQENPYRTEPERSGDHGPPPVRPVLSPLLYERAGKPGERLISLAGEHENTPCPGEPICRLPCPPPSLSGWHPGRKN